MLKIVRGEIPNYLASWKSWGKSYPNSYQSNWNKIHTQLLKDLGLLTHSSCTFCGAGDPLRETGETIEHFKPKYLYPNLSFCWDNLFLCCTNCQKNTGFHKEYKKNKKYLLKPDRNYSFSTFFKYETNTGMIIPKSNDLNSFEHQCAEYTRKYYRLNDFGRPEARKNYFDENISKGKDVLNSSFLKYRFLFE